MIQKSANSCSRHQEARYSSVAELDAVSLKVGRFVGCGRLEMEAATGTYSVEVLITVGYGERHHKSTTSKVPAEIWQAGKAPYLREVNTLIQAKG